MSVAEITGRIGQIQAQLAMLTPVRTSPASASTFAAALGDATSARTAVPADGGIGEQAVAEARKYLGMPYVWGGDDPADGGMDCSGLVQHVYETLGVDLPRVSADQARAGVPVASLAEARPGDLIAWDNSSRNVGADHIAIYVGGGKMIEAPRTGLDIRIVDVPTTPDYIRRVAPAEAPAATGATGPTGPAYAVGSTGSLPSPTLDGDVPYRWLFESAGERHGVDPALLAAVARQESGFDPRAVSHAGAQGLMQLMPGTAAGLGVEDPFDPVQAVHGAATLLRQLLDRFDGRLDLALAGYNAGPGAVDRYDGIPPYPETRNYVASVLAMVQGGRP